MPAKKPATPRYTPAVRQYRNSPNPRINPDRKVYYVGVVMTKKGKSPFTRHICETPREDPTFALADADAAIIRLQQGKDPGLPKVGQEKPAALSGTVPSLPPMRVLMLNLPSAEKVMLYHLAKGGTHLELSMARLGTIDVVQRLRSSFLMSDSTAHDIRDLIISTVSATPASYVLTINAQGAVWASPR